MAALELHPPQWTIDAAGQRQLPDRLVVDLDPDAGTTIVGCCRVAERLHDILTADGLTRSPKPPARKRMQLYCGITTNHADAPAAYAKQLARETPDTITAMMAKAQRTASTPVTGDEVRACRTSADPTFTADDVLHRIDEHGDLLAGLHVTRVALPGR